MPVVLDVEGGDLKPDKQQSPQHLLAGAVAAAESGVNVVVVGLEETVSDTELPFVVARSRQTA